MFRPLSCCASVLCAAFILFTQGQHVSAFADVLHVSGGISPSSAASSSRTQSADFARVGRSPRTLSASSESADANVISDDKTPAIEEAKEKLQHHFNFPLDSWQLEAGYEILQGRNVIVSAPTGAGKTVVGEMALWSAFERNLNAIYTTPLKALSNQKFVELRKIFGADNVGLATGDMSINRGARITVMTTEVYRNMAWRASGSKKTNAEDAGDDEDDDDDTAYNDLVSNDVVVLDEFHYMGLPGRGGVWEECIITSPPHTKLVGLSATLPNADRLAQWMGIVTGRQTNLVEAATKRPVPLRYLYASSEGLNAMFRDSDAGPGAPNGLLGLRGDGNPEKQKSERSGKQKKKGFSADEPEVIKEGKFPKGLQVNPTLLQAIEKKRQKIDRRIQRQALKQREEYGDEWGGQPRKARLSAREERKERDRMMRQEMRRSVPSLPFLLRRLDQKNLLPAIFFIFSRAGCDDAARYVCNDMRQKLKIRNNRGEAEDELGDEPRKGKRKSRQRRRGRGRRQANSDQDWYSADESTNLAKDESGRSFRRGSGNISDQTMASIFDAESRTNARHDESSDGSSPYAEYASLGLLDLSAVKEVAARVSAFNEENPELAFDEEEAECFMFGVGSHHAGMLAAHKAFVESLFKAQLMKAVFATETLAAGINMPARTTVVCSMAKRGDNSAMNLLETSNLLQMAGRAGRRGMDTEGTCVVVATPFEGPTEAQSILTSEISPIKSQFTPSYSLATNLVARGEGKLDVARSLVEKSFAMWEQSEANAALSGAIGGGNDQDMDGVLQAIAEERFMDTLKETLLSLLAKGKFDKPARQKSRVYAIVDVISNRKILKKESKGYLALSRMLELELNTLQYLELEAGAMEFPSEKTEESDLLGDLFAEDFDHLEEEMETQKRRVRKSERDANTHVFANMAGYANTVLLGSGPEAETLQAALAEARPDKSNDPVSAEELTTFAKSATVVSRKKTKLMNKNAGSIDKSSTQSLLDSILDVGSFEENTWNDMLALVSVLEAYGCITPQHETVSDAQDQTYALTQAGKNIGMLGMDNSLWGLVAMGGAWDVANESAELDDFRSAMESFESDEDDSFDATPLEEESNGLSDKISKPQKEAEVLISLLRDLTPHELAGYVSCLVSEGSRGSSSVVESFMKLTPAQQPVIQRCLLSLERLMDVQKRLSVDETSSKCLLDLSTCDVVTAWASGCSWSEALEISGSAPGDLARTLHRALDALRQFGSLPYSPARATGILPQTESFGIHPESRRLCRSAAAAMDRYPVKDPLPFDEEEGEVIEPDEVREGVDNIDEEIAVDA